MVNSCGCDKTLMVHAGSGMEGVVKKELTKAKRTNKKRCLQRQANS